MCILVIYLFSFYIHIRQIYYILNTSCIQWISFILVNKWKQRPNYFRANFLSPILWNIYVANIWYNILSDSAHWNIYFWLRFIFVYQKPLKQTLKPVNLSTKSTLNFCAGVMNSQRFFCSQKASLKYSY